MSCMCSYGKGGGGGGQRVRRRRNCDFHTAVMNAVNIHTVRSFMIHSTREEDGGERERAR